VILFCLKYHHVSDTQLLGADDQTQTHNPSSGESGPDSPKINITTY